MGDVEKEKKLYIRRFPDAKAQCMDDYKKLSMRDKPDNLIVHVWTNDLNCNQNLLQNQ